MGWIKLTNLSFTPPATAVQIVSVYTKIASAPDVPESYSLVSNNVQVQPSGFFFTPLDINGLTDGAEYTVKIVNNCGGGGWKANFVAGHTTAPITTAPPETTAPVTTAPPETTAPPTVPPTTEAPTTQPPATTAPPTVSPTTAAPTTQPATTIANQAIVTLNYGLMGMPSAEIALTESGDGSLANSPLIASEAARSRSTLLSPAGIHSFNINVNLPESRNFVVRAFINGTIYFTNSYSGSGPSVFIIAQNIAPGSNVYITVDES